MKYDLDFIRKNDLIIFEAKMGSHAYGTNIPTSDIDIRGIFIQPLEDIFRYGYTDQVADQTNDIVFYELKRFMELLSKNNPNIIELLAAPEDCIIHKSPLYDLIQIHTPDFITKKCRFTFAGYAIEQIKKARGYNKKINWEEKEMKRKGVLDFCYVLIENDSILFQTWVEREFDNLSYKDFALAKIDHAHDIYAMFRMYDNEPKGIVKDIEKANSVQLHSIPKGRSVEEYLTFNKDAYSTHCKRYKEYTTWLKERNKDRFKMNKDHGKNYDSKNMSHCIRLLDTAIEIGSGKGLIVRRPKEHIKLLLSIRKGEMEYDDLIQSAESKIELLDNLFEESNLPNSINKKLIPSIELDIRNRFYNL